MAATVVNADFNRQNLDLDRFYKMDNVVFKISATKIESNTSTNWWAGIRQAIACGGMAFLFMHNLTGYITAPALTVSLTLINYKYTSLIKEILKHNNKEIIAAEKENNPYVDLIVMPYLGSGNIKVATGRIDDISDEWIREKLNPTNK